jgi:hypothetical protein
MHSVVSQERTQRQVNQMCIHFGHVIENAGLYHAHHMLASAITVIHQ